MGIKVCMASHLGSSFRYDTIEETLDSIAKQTHKPNEVLIAYSYDFEPPDENKWQNILGNIPLKTIVSNTQQYQFAHYKQLLPFIDDKDLVCFVDDDDLFAPNKIEQLYNIYMSDNFKGVIKHNYTAFYKNGDNNIIYEPGNCNEYWLYSLQGNIFKRFFESDIIEDFNSSFHMIDLLFAAWISTSTYEDIYYINDRLMFIRKDLLIPRNYGKKLEGCNILNQTS